MSSRNLILSLFFGFLVGSLILGFYELIKLGSTLRNQFSYLVFFMPVVYLLQKLLVRKTLFFPQKVIELNESQEQNQTYWNRFMTFFHLSVTSLNHLVGASVGREGAIVVMSSGLASMLNLNLNFWVPVLAAAGFATAVGPFWLALIFIFEMYETNIFQKIYAVIVAWTSSLVLNTYLIHFQLTEDLFFKRLVPDLQFNADSSSFGKLQAVIVAVTCLAVLSRYKIFLIKKIRLFLSQKIILSVIVLAILSWVLAKPQMSQYQSLGLESLSDFFNNKTVSWEFIMIKLTLTALFVAIGVWGGEFVPLVLCGVALGFILEKYFPADKNLVIALCSYGLFTAVTRLKWTGLFLVYCILGYNGFIWIYLAYSLLMALTQKESLYFEKKNYFQI